MNSTKIIILCAICAQALICIVSCNYAKAQIVNNYDDVWDEDAVDTAAVDTVDWEDYSEVSHYDPDFDDIFKVTSVAGVSFGTSRSTALSALRSRFNYSDVDEGNCVTFWDDVSIGGINYNYARFYFIDDKLAAASLVKYFSIKNFQAAKNLRDRIAGQYHMKYRNMYSNTDHNGIKFYQCGRLDFIWYPIKIYINKGKGVDGIMRYYVTVDYFSHKIGSALNEDI